MRKTKFQNDYYYHIYNRGVDKRDIFMDEKDYFRFLRSMREFNCLEPIGSLFLQDSRDSHPVACEPLGGLNDLVEFIAYCLNPNHYHFILKQKKENGISKLMHKLTMGYAQFFNNKYNRSGALFQGKFKSVHMNTDSYLLWLSGYVNGNSEIHKISKAEEWPWSSYRDYLGLRNGTLCNNKIILNQFENTQEYKELVNIIIKESDQRKDDIKKYLLE